MRFVHLRAPFVANEVILLFLLVFENSVGVSLLKMFWKSFTSEFFQPLRSAALVTLRKRKENFFFLLGWIVFCESEIFYFSLTETIIKNNQILPHLIASVMFTFHFSFTFVFCYRRYKYRVTSQTSENMYSEKGWN